MIKVIHGEIWSNDFTELDQLIRDFQSCVRFSYWRANTNPLAHTESEAQLQRDTHLVDLMQRQGGIFFAGADHVGNVRKLLKGQ